MNKFLFFALFLCFCTPQTCFSQSDEILNYTRTHRPSEANFKYKKYNEYASNYNEKRLARKRNIENNFLGFLGYMALTFAIGEGLGYVIDGKTDEKNSLVAAGVSGIIYIWALIEGGFGSSPEKALSAYRVAIEEKNRLGIK